MSQSFKTVRENRPAVRLAVVGGRDFRDYDLMLSTLDNLSMNIIEIISGGARGADALAERYARARGIKILVFKPDWKGKGRSAGIERNKDIVENCDQVVAFWDGESPGTKNTIERTRNAGKKLLIIRYSNEK